MIVMAYLDDDGLKIYTVFHEVPINSIKLLPYLYLRAKLGSNVPGGFGRKANALVISNTIREFHELEEKKNMKHSLPVGQVSHIEIVNVRVSAKMYSGCSEKVAKISSTPRDTCNNVVRSFTYKVVFISYPMNGFYQLRCWTYQSREVYFSYLLVFHIPSHLVLKEDSGGNDVELVNSASWTLKNGLEL
ncbi:hypothetical protein C0J52_25022 [Blattella germanica]|nr:hypothetical protein C0J52_25022 [Blattella germanica]